MNKRTRDNHIKKRLRELLALEEKEWAGIVEREELRKLAEKIRQEIK